MGVLQILIGVGYTLMAPVSLLATKIAPANAAGSPSTMLALTGAIGMVGFGVTTIILGIGSYRACRWARSIWYALGWIGLCAGLASLPLLGAITRELEKSFAAQGVEVPPGVILVSQIMTIGIGGAMYVLIPVLLIRFYGSPHVIRTCEARDPVERWTDRVPTGLLPMILMLGVGAAYSVINALLPGFGSVFPLFGFFVTNLAARLLWISMAALMGWAAFGFYHRSIRAWIGTLVAMPVFVVSFWMTLRDGGLIEYYRMSGLPDSDLQILEASPLMHGGFSTVLFAIGPAFYLVYLIWLRRFFVARARRGGHLE